jgi:CheY-like chemotaxis protein
MSHLFQGRKLEILLAEDSRIDARLTILALRRSRVRHRLTLVRDGDEAIRFLRRQGIFRQAPVPDIILLDLVMPRCDGWEVLRARAADPRLREIPVVVLTGCHNPDELQAVRELGIDELLEKPVKVERFLTIMHNLKHHLQNDWHLPGEQPEPQVALGAGRGSPTPPWVRPQVSS